MAPPLPASTLGASAAADAPPIVRVAGVTMRYANGVTALDGIDLDIPRGKLTTLLGPSGCGKTTLLKIIAGLLRPTTGTVAVNGKSVAGPGPERALVFQDFALLPWATVLRNVAFGLELRGVARSEREAIAAKYIREVGLAGFENQYPNQLSGGMRQRAGLARALTVNADILMMDEPFSAVDEQMRRKLQEDLLSLLAVEKKTVIVVTHSIEEAVYLSDRIVLLSRRPSRVSAIRDPGIAHDMPPDQIRRDRRYLDTVDEIWDMLKQYLI
ncbi:ABC transporter [Rhodoplanes elegans]|uniref:ABC transporter n=1 Tax=Rhodoplanes elegans TaxID=29408 RepID=A0A327KS69_9BRAD|nr:ABC transporter [Rhodoplanes elegans]RAI41780.1 ABC transporter [Rhodoplanes elegans]